MSEYDILYTSTVNPSGLTSTENNGSNKQGQITVIQLQSIKLDSKLKLGLHDLTEGLS